MEVRPSSGHEIHLDSSHLGRGQLQVRLLFLTIGMLLLGEAMVQPFFYKEAGHESVERRFLRSSHAMMRKRVPPRKGPLEQPALSADGPAQLEGSWLLEQPGSGVSWAADPSTAANGSACQRMLWFTCLGPAPSAEQQRQLRAALLSARRHAPSLLPVLVHSGSGGAEGEGPARWFREVGGHVMQHTLSFLALLEEQPDRARREALLWHQGGFLRLDVPLLVERIVEEGLLDLGNVTTQYALYTDTDVLFLGDSAGSGSGSSSGSREEGPNGSGSGRSSSGPDTGSGPAPGDISTCSVPAPDLIMMGREHVGGAPWDTGVLLLNVPALRAALPALLQFGREQGFAFPGWEQGLINAYLRAKAPALEVLPDRLSYKPYWGALPGGATLLHWLGPKPSHARCMRCYLEQAQRHKGAAGWAAACGCSRLQYKSVFQQAPDHGRMYAQALDLYESYLAAAGREEGSGAFGDGAVGTPMAQQQ